MMGLDDFRVVLTPATAQQRADYYRDRIRGLDAALDLAAVTGREPTTVEGALRRMYRQCLWFAEAQLANPVVNLDLQTLARDYFEDRAASLGGTGPQSPQAPAGGDNGPA